MSSPISAKRRKLNDATKTLRKPFISPMRTLKPETTPLKENTNQANIAHQPYMPSTLAHTIKPAYTTPRPALTNPASTRPILNPSKSTPLRKQPSLTFSSSKKTSPEEQAAQKTIASIERQIRSLTNDLDTLKQAHQLETSTTDDELRELAEKWRICSQSVCEELFGSVKERVCRMGGVAAWREMEKKKHDRAHGVGEFAPQEEEQGDDDADCEFDSEGEELPEEEQEYRKRMKRQAIQEMKDAADVEEKPEEDATAQKGQVWQESGKDDDTFTMDMMLRSLNIDLEVIGFDKETQKWT